MDNTKSSVRTTQGQVFIGLRGFLSALKKLSRMRVLARYGKGLKHAAQAALGVTLFFLWWGYPAFFCAFS